MNLHVAQSAILVARVGQVVRRRLRGDAVSLAAEISGPVMAFQAEREDGRAL
jgi:hypothetical protein